MSNPQIPSPSHPERTEVQVDLSTIICPPIALGQIKPAPVCLDEALKKESMTSEEISKHCFASIETPKCELDDAGLHHETPMVSSASSTASRDSLLSDVECTHKLIPSCLERKHSEQINLKVAARKTSRSGSESQRWFTDPKDHRVYRMVTGCVPIVEGGKILLVSASRKPEWILPKGGWEQDEDMEESAIRECFEEAGVLGFLGPRLSEVEYETRKAKKRRLQYEEIQQKTQKQARAADLSSPLSTSTTTRLEGTDDTCEVMQPTVATVSDDEFVRIRGQGLKGHFSDDASSVADDASEGHTHVRMSLFPLYVTEVKSCWPESGRFRKIVEIEEAIKMCEARPELQKVLLEVKDRNLHLLSCSSTKNVAII